MYARVLFTSLGARVLLLASMLINPAAAQQPTPDTGGDDEIERIEREINQLRQRLTNRLRQRGQSIRERRDRNDARSERNVENRGPSPQDVGNQQPHSVLQERERAEHLEQALHHLRSAGFGDEAERIQQRVGSNLHGVPAPASNGRDFGPWGEAAQQQMGHVHHALSQLGDAVRHLEEKAQHSDRIAQAADEAHQRVNEIQRHVENRTRDLEDHFSRQFGDVESRFQDIEKHLRGFGDELEARLSERIENFEREQARLREHVEQRLESDQDKDQGKDEDDDDHDEN